MCPDWTSTIAPEIVVEAAREVAGPESRWVRDEVALLAPIRPDRWVAGYHLRGTITTHRGRPGTPAPGALVESSFTAKRNGEALVRGRDYLIDPFWSAVGGTRIPEVALLEYGYRLRRIDSIVRGPSGETWIARGTSQLTTPRPPLLPSDVTRVANVFVPYEDDPQAVETLPIGVRRQVVPTSRPLPHMAAALARNHVRIAFWGDSVTAGGDTTAAEAFPAVCESALAERYPDSKVSTEVVAYDGSTSRDWITGATECDIGALDQASPDVVVVEFVNDATLPPNEWTNWYEEISRHVQALGADLVLSTPHWTMREWMPDVRSTNEDHRPYVAFLRDYATKTGSALADVSRAWGGLREEGIPYETLLSNGINHPDERGHALAARVIVDELTAGAEAAR